MTAAHRRERRLWLALCLALAAALIAVTTARAATPRRNAQEQPSAGIQLPAVGGVESVPSELSAGAPLFGDTSGGAPLPEWMFTPWPSLEAVRLPATPRPERPTALSGIASWYCLAGRSRCTAGYPDGLYAAIRRDLLGHRGDRARVCRQDAPATCVVIRVIDCNCGPSANLVDLYSAAFARLAPLGTGRIAVTLEWL